MCSSDLGQLFSSLNATLGYNCVILIDYNAGIHCKAIICTCSIHTLVTNHYHSLVHIKYLLNGLLKLQIYFVAENLDLERRMAENLNQQRLQSALEMASSKH